MSEIVKVSRFGRTMAAATIASIIFVPIGVLSVFALEHFGVETIRVDHVVFFSVGWMIMDFIWDAWRGPK